MAVFIYVTLPKMFIFPILCIKFLLFPPTFPDQSNFLTFRAFTTCRNRSRSRTVLFNRAGNERGLCCEKHWPRWSVYRHTSCQNEAHCAVPAFIVLALVSWPRPWCLHHTVWSVLYPPMKSLQSSVSRRASSLTRRNDILVFGDYFSCSF